MRFFSLFPRTAEWRAAFVGGALAFAICAISPTAHASSISIGEAIGNLEAVLSDGRPIPFDSIPNQVTVVVFGASWCPPCGPIKMAMEGEQGRRLVARSPNLKLVYIQVDLAYDAAMPSPMDLDRHYWFASVDFRKFKFTPLPANPKFWSGRSWYTSNLPNALAVDQRGVVIGKGRGGEWLDLVEQADKRIRR